MYNSLRLKFRKDKLFPFKKKHYTCFQNLFYYTDLTGTVFTGQRLTLLGSCPLFYFGFHCSWFLSCSVFLGFGSSPCRSHQVQVNNYPQLSSSMLMTLSVFKCLLFSSSVLSHLFLFLVSVLLCLSLFIKVLTVVGE